jgi:hypothetical protein
MFRHRRTFVLILIVLAAAVFVLLQTNGDGPPFAPNSTAEGGTSLFYDTLRHMGCPVRMVYTPLTRQRDIRNAVVIIQPYNPPVTVEMAEEMLEWVRLGGRLVFLHNSGPPELDLLLLDMESIGEGGFFRYTIGLGEIVTGRAHGLTNIRLMNDPAPGEVLHRIISSWGTERIDFSLYYHGYRPPETMFSELPLVMRLVLIQLGLAGLAVVWHLGKRFGKPVPAFEETEREENEEVRALARLYMKTKTRK